MSKIHVPALGKSSNFSGEALCGRWVKWSTADHGLIRRNAKASKASGEDGHYCATCIKRV